MINYNTFDDSKLLELLKDSDPSAFTAIYQKYWKGMFFICFSRLEERGMAEAVVQDVFCRLWQNRMNNFRPALETWLATSLKFQTIVLVNRRLGLETAITLSTTSIQRNSGIDQRCFELHLASENNKLPQDYRLRFVYHPEVEHSHKNGSIYPGASARQKGRYLSLTRKMLMTSLFTLTHKWLSGDVSSYDRESLELWYLQGLSDGAEVKIIALHAWEDEPELKYELYSKIIVAAGIDQ